MPFAPDKTAALKCPKCSAPLAPDSSNCMACLMRLGIDTEDPALDELPDDTGSADGANTESWPQLSNYRILRELGEGGFGVVYAAEQIRPVHRDVAVKVIKPGMDTRGVIAHFASERQALAVMDHPGIARVFDAGSTEAGRAFFAMELVAGTPVTAYCDQMKLGIRERIGLFIQICQAVEHAHQKGIIHRDLKPSNVLVIDQDGRPLPKIIDFGIAKAIGGERLDDRTLFTAFEPFLGTPTYMSPEQADFGGTDIDTRSDIYSLGVMLYELLSGSPPFRHLARTGLDETRRKIRDEVPPVPSAAVGALPAAEQSTVATSRGTEPPKLIRSLRGDIDSVTMKALEKDRVRRYATATGLAADLRRCLDAEPVTARPPSTGYRVSQFIRRNKTPVLAATVVAVAIIAAAIVSVVEAVRARAAEQRALTEARKTEQTSSFLEDAFVSITPEVAKAHDTTLLRNILEGADQHINAIRDLDPEVAAHMLRIIGWSYHKMGDDPKAEADLGEAAEMFHKLPGQDFELCVSLDWLSYVQSTHNLAEATESARQAYLVQSRLADSLDTRSQVAKDLATYNMAYGKMLIGDGKIDEGVAIERKWLDFQKAALGDTDNAIAGTLNNLGQAEVQQKHWPQAEVYFRQALAIRRKVDGDDSIETASALGTLAGVIEDQGDSAGAEAMVRQSLALERKFLPPNSLDIVRSLYSLAGILIGEHRPDEAEPLLKEAVSANSLSSVNSSGAIRVLHALMRDSVALADAYDQAGQKQKAEPWRSEANLLGAQANAIK
jgi:eukaryotic-like serine/threonine-protein kinase